MSVRTTADEKIESARDNISSAVASLAEVIVGRCWGYDEFNDEFNVKMKNAFKTLIELRDTL